jgi:glyoxylase-like metal-dependent hydrolase (beta-lactamase superfamily II)
MNLGSVELGRFTVNAIDGGGVWMDGGAIFGVVSKPLWCGLTPADEMNRVRLSFFSLLVRDGEHTVVVEGGSAVHQPPKVAEYHRADPPTLIETLGLLGVAARDVDFFIPSHLHFDHVGGAAEGPEGGVAFPDAAYVVQQDEWNEANDPMPINKNAYLPGDIEPLKNAKLLLVDGDAEILPGIRVKKSGGHSVGHQIIEIGDGAESLVFAGDLVPTSEHISPRWMCAFDVYPVATYKWKVELLERAAAQGSLIAPGHGGKMPIFGLDRDERGRFTGKCAPSIRPCGG